jgi:hypothetical protein
MIASFPLVGAPVPYRKVPGHTSPCLHAVRVGSHPLKPSPLSGLLGIQQSADASPPVTLTHPASRPLNRVLLHQERADDVRLTPVRLGDNTPPQNLVHHSLLVWLVLMQHTEYYARYKALFRWPQQVGRTSGGFRKRPSLRQTADRPPRQRTGRPRQALRIRCKSHRSHTRSHPRQNKRPGKRCERTLPCRS